jgi:outer membrane receptor protein involved in Fe transport
MSHRFSLARLFGACAALASAALSGPAFAQQATSNDSLDEVTVTGSRIITDGNDAPTPVTVVTLDALKATTPTTVFGELSELPAFTVSRGPTTPNGYFANGNNGTAALDLRGIGSQRVLALFDGHRVPPSTPDGIVNVNLLPQMLMQRVDVVTGGASAVYGSDAISGVINFIVDRRFNGVKAELQGGTSSEDDDRSFQVGLAAGTDLFGGRGHIEGSYQRILSAGLGPTKLSRPGIFDWSLQGDGVTVPYHMVQGTRQAFVSYGGRVCNPCGSNPSNGAFNDYNFAQNGVLTPFVHGSTAGLNNGTELGGDGAASTSTWMASKTRTDQLFVRFDFDVTDKVHAYFNAGAAIDYSYAGFQPAVDAHLGFGACNAYLSPALQAGFGCTNQADPNQPGFYLFKLPDVTINLLKTTESGATARNYDVLAGIQGEFATGYHWDTSVTLSQTSQKVVAYGIDEDPHLAAALDAVVGPNGQIVCNVTLTNPGLYPGCAPLNLFGPTSESQAGLNYTFGDITRTATSKLLGWDGTVNGNPFNDWAGPVGMAISADFRRQALDVTSTSVATGSNCTGLRFDNCDPVQTNTWGNTVQPLPAVHQNAAEVAYEANVPLVKDVPFFQSLSANAAARYTRYTNNGEGFSSNISANTWKLGLVWALNDQLTLRATRSRDIRAPNLWDLFNPIATQPFSQTNDYLTAPPGHLDVSNNGVGPPVTSGGNPFLKPEVGNTLTYGFVYRPTPDFSLSADAYDIKITDAITVLTGFDQSTQQACYDSGGTSPTCSLQDRALHSYTDTSAANFVTKYYQRGVNIAGIHTKGVDVESNYRTRLADHALSVRALLSYKPHLIYSEPTFKTIDQAGAAYYQGFGGLFPAPKLRAELVVNYNLFKGLDFNMSERWRDSMRLQGDSSLAEVGHVASVAYTNVNVSYAPPSMAGASFFLNVQNLFNRAPPVSPQGGFAVGDDVIGTYFTVGVRAHL